MTDNPLNQQTPMIRNRMEEYLMERARRGGIDDWEPLIDDHLTYEENVALIIREGGKPLESEEQRQRRADLRDADDRIERHAREAVIGECTDVVERKGYAVFDALLDGERPRETNGDLDRAEQVVIDVRDEYGDEFVREAGEICRSEHEARIEARTQTFGSPSLFEPLADSDPFDFVDYGPSMDDPVPLDDLAPGPELEGTGLTPEDFDPWIDVDSPGIEYEPQTRGGHQTQWVTGVPEDEDAFIAQHLAEQVDVMGAGSAFGSTGSVHFERAVPTGRYTPPGAVPDRSVPPDRDSASGRFVSPNRVPANIGRDSATGYFRPLNGNTAESWW